MNNGWMTRNRFAELILDMKKDARVMGKLDVDDGDVGGGVPGSDGVDEADKEAGTVGVDGRVKVSRRLKPDEAMLEEAYGRRGTREAPLEDAGEAAEEGDGGDEVRPAEAAAEVDLTADAAPAHDDDLTAMLADADAEAAAAADTRQGRQKRFYSSIRLRARRGRLQGHALVDFRDGSKYEGPWHDVGQTPQTAYDWRTLPRRAARQDPGSALTAKHVTAGKDASTPGVEWIGADVSVDFDPADATGQFEVRDAAARTTYSGRVEGGGFHGFGRLAFAAPAGAGGYSTGEYVGEFRYGLRHGHGVQTLAAGEVYVGGWAGGFMAGRGKQRFKDGSW